MNITDQLNQVSPEDASRAAFIAVTGIQDLSPGEQVTGAAMLFILLAKRFDLSTGRTLRVLEQSEVRLKDCLDADVNRKPGEYARALREYMATEL